MRGWQSHHSAAERALATQIAEYLGTRRGAELIVEAVVEVIRDEVREHTENSPHIYADGSTS